jgi:hypothetical protein
MICSSPPVFWVKTTPITLFSTAIYNQKGIMLCGTLSIGGADKYSLISSNIACCSAP